MESAHVVSLRRQPTQEPQPPRLPQKRTRQGRRRFAVAALLVVAALLFYGARRFFSGGRTEPRAAAGQHTAASAGSKQEAVDDTIAKVGKLIELPHGETPTVATVTDPEKLKGQTFFANAKAGDVVLLYTVSRKAYLYDPVNNKLVDVAPITTTAQ